VLEEEPDRPPGPDEVRIETLYSGLSAGTELTAYRGTNPYLAKRWDPQRRLFLEGGAPTFAYPLRGWGYEEVGRIVSVGRDVPARHPELAAGTVVYGTWGHRTHHVAPAEEVAARLLPEGLPPLAGILSHVGAVALNGVLDAGVRIGETVAVFGLGVVGRLVARLCTASGTRVVGIDRYEARRRAALEAGDVGGAVAAGPDVAEHLKDATDGRGADVAIEAAGAAAALQQAIRSVAYGARVIVLGFLQGGAEALRLGEEFHHNRVQLVGSQIGGVASELAGRWDRRRLIATVMELQREGVLDPRPLVSRVVPFERAADAYAWLDRDPEGTLWVLLAGPAAPPWDTRR
jgi:2-desacetyl-2-hydroxyethyl bacteriochlorophyllide A dehydrogenase